MAKKKVLRFLLFLIPGIALVGYIFRDTDLKFLQQEIRNIHWSWIILSISINIGSQLFRAMRWKLLFREIDYNPRLKSVFLSYLILIFTNQIIPRSGEVVRLGIISNYEKIPLAKVLGTALAERITDLLMMMLIFIFLLSTQYNFIRELLELPNVELPEISIIQISLIAGGIILVILISYFILKLTGVIKKILSKVGNFLAQTKQGLKTVITLKRKTNYILLTFLVFFSWFIMQYILFFAYSPTQNLSVTTAFIVFILAAFAFLLPVQAGIGAWHFVVIVCLLFFEISRPAGEAFSLIAHACITLIFYLLGGLAVTLLPLLNKKSSYLTEKVVT